ncbi:Nucleoside 2-deoxyribosyltransferase [Thalassoglobus neptunius]|uniref:Nucleoside 2-deoxyribosyltransferase n=1 Tax=Thalassoglobus neptunius TaxID=1938619 RepID=A0A5C5X731_9PLAN|nr:nucleoside 2-deoxyribosyltransferase [Thalassoglobus neptunius]TWT58927.1 Nucleoside 2-deoxyribosyltransferase [Thalassoglobus neptunius]
MYDSVYLAARYSRRLELCEYRTALEANGIKVTSRWLNGFHQIGDDGTPINEEGEALVEEGDNGSRTEQSARLRLHFANEDVADVRSCNVLIAFTEPPRSSASRGGRHVELGMALGMGKPVIVVGHRENIFCWLDCVKFVESFEDALVELNRLQPQKSFVAP